MPNERMKQLIELLNKYRAEYYEQDNPTVSDKEYDELYDELKALESASGVVLNNSPTRLVGGEPLAKFSKHTHLGRLYSLDKAVTSAELRAFDLRVRKAYSGTLKYTVEYKFDGLTMCLTYVDGKFYCASTRGNGIVGEDVTRQVKTMQNIPLEINYKGTIEVQGEAIIRLSNLEKYNKTAREPLKNARNAVAGAIRNLDPEETRKRFPEIMFYNVNYASNGGFSTQLECVDFLKKQGFNVHPYIAVCNTIDEVESAIDDIEISRKSLDILTDGAVVKVDDFECRNILGSTDKFPRWAIAFKFEAEERTTMLREVVWQVGRTGKLTPLGKLDEVELNGATVKNATLNNYGDILRKKIAVPCRVLIRRSNDVIPEILGSTELFENSVVPKKPEVCPFCGSQTVSDGANVFCPNEDCKPRVVAYLSHFASKDGYNIDGFSEMTASQLFDAYGVDCGYKLFELNREQLLSLDGFKDKKADNLLSSLDKSKSVPFANFIFSLGIDGVGKKTSADLAKRFMSLDELMNAKNEDFLKIDEIGDILAKNLTDFFKNDKNIQKIGRLIVLGVTIIAPKARAEGGAFFGENVVLTGSLNGYTRGEAGKIIESLGGVVQSAVTRTTTLVVYGEAAGSKLDKAKKLGIKLLDEAEFNNMIREK